MAKVLKFPAPCSGNPQCSQVACTGNDRSHVVIRRRRTSCVNQTDQVGCTNCGLCGQNESPDEEDCEKHDCSMDFGRLTFRYGRYRPSRSSHAREK